MIVNNNRHNDGANTVNKVHYFDNDANSWRANIILVWMFTVIMLVMILGLQWYRLEIKLREHFGKRCVWLKWN